MRDLRRRFWFACMDAFHAIGWTRAWLWSIGKASECMGWERGELWDEEGL